MNSGRTVFLYGPAGSGKTHIAERLVHALNGDIAIPHAVAVNGDVIQVFDPLVHRPVDMTRVRTIKPDGGKALDDRWVACERPVVLTGGELTLSMLDLDMDQNARFYQAPPHLKANNGVLIIDDLGRQLVSARDLMNRWIVPMDRRKDHLALQTGYRFAIPFDVILIFSSNLRPKDLADEAFIRRLGYKIHVGPLDENEYRTVFKQACEALEIPFVETAFDYLLSQHHAKEDTPLLACYPRDLLKLVKDLAIYEVRPATLSRDVLDWAWNTYFARH